MRLWDIHPSAAPKPWSKPGSSGGRGGPVNITHFKMEEDNDGERVGVTYEQLHCHPGASLWFYFQDRSFMV